jgi:DNA-binding CsgD family transcriptional regulator
MVRLKLTLEQKLKIAALSRAGVRQQKIAAQLQLNVRQVRRFQRESGLPMPSNGLPKQLVDKILELHRAGKFQREISQELGLNELTIAKYRRAAGLPAHQPGAIAPKEAADISKRLERGQTGSRIARELNIPYCRVLKVARGRHE